MTSFASESLRLLRRVLRGTGPAPAHRGAPVALDGVSAVASLEARIADVAGLGASYPSALAARVWDRHAADQPLNLSGVPPASIAADGPRTALASATGAALAGRRASVFLSGPDLMQCRDLLEQAAGRRVPLVVHTVLRAPGAHAQAIGTGHEPLHALDGLACVKLIASNAQQAVDLTLIARRAAELALTPVVVAMDAEQTALAVQDVVLPDDRLAHAFLGAPADVIQSPGAAQRIIFGDTRRRVPRLYDLDHPMLLGPLQGPEVWALGAGAATVHLGRDLARVLDEAVEAFAAQTGRRHEPLRLHRTADARTALIAQGSLVETAIAVADWAREHAHARVGVIGITRADPLDEAGLCRALKGVRTACVLERVAFPPGADGPLMRRVRAALERAIEASRAEGPAPGDPQPIGPKDLPRLLGAAAGLGGLPVKAADLALLISELDAPKRSCAYLGLDFTRRGSEFPKHQALLDSLRREFPDVSQLGLTDSDRSVGPAAQAFTTVSVLRAAGGPDGVLAGQLAQLAHASLGGGLRSRPAVTWQRSDDPCDDRLCFGEPGLLDPGDDPRIDVLIVASGDARALESIAPRLAEEAIVLIPPHLAGEPRLAPVLAAAHRAGRALRTVQAPAGDAELAREALLGGALRLLIDRRAKAAPVSQLRTRRTQALGAMPEERRQSCVDAFARGYESVRALEPSAPADPARARQPEEITVPPELAGMRGDGVTSLPRFWDHEGGFYGAGRTDELVAEPGLAPGAVPALASSLRAIGRGADSMIAFEPRECDGDPSLWMSCPDGSVAPLAITPRSLMDAAIDLATRAGDQADALRPLLGQLSKRIAKLAAGDEPPQSAAGFLRGAFDDVTAKLDAPDDRKSAMRDALAAVVRQVGALPLAVTDIFFRNPERASPGSGALLSLVVNPEACKCPELIASRAEGHGLRLIPRTPEALATARELWRLWQRLPDTPGEVIERARNDARLGALPAMMLSRHCLHAMAPGDGAEPASGAKLALRQVLAVAEFHYQPRVQKLLGEIEQLHGKLSDRIQSLLARALPTADLDALGKGLEMLGGGDVELAELSAKVDSAIVDGHIDGELLRAHVDAARALADLRWKLADGPLGLGRARVGLAIASGATPKWSAVFPGNPFLAPTTIDACSEAGGLARGLLEGHLRDALETASLLRLSRTLLDRPAEAPHAAEALKRLTFEGLTPAERELVTPVLLVGDAQAIGARGLSQLVWLLSADYPVKVIVLSDAGGRADGALSLDVLGAYPPAQRYDTAILAMLARKAFVAQVSIARPSHLAASVERALATSGPALIHVHTPSPERHGFDVRALFDQAELALASRAWPVFTFDPAAPGVFGACLEISANPSPGERWTTTDTGHALTPAHWAATEARFDDQLTPLEAAAPAPTDIADYLALDPAARAGRTPFVKSARYGAPVRLRPGERLLQDVLERARLWRTLQELSGEVTPFTEKVRAEAEQAVAASHRAELARLAAEHEQRIALLRAEFAAETTDHVTARLMSLAGYNGSGSTQ